MAARELWGQMYDTCDPVSKEISVVLKHLTTEGKTKDGSDTDYMSYFDSAVAEKYLLEIYLPSEGNTDYSLWFDKDGLTAKMTGDPTCSVLPILVKTTKDQDGQDVAIKTYYTSFKLNITKEANDTESDFKQILLTFLRSKMYVLNGLIGENNEAYESDLVPFAGGKKAAISSASLIDRGNVSTVTEDSVPIKAEDHPASKDNYYKYCFIDTTKNYKTFIKLIWQEKYVKESDIHKHWTKSGTYNEYFSTNPNPGNNENVSFTNSWVAQLMTSEGNAFTTMGALSSRVDEKLKGNESCFYVNSLGTKFFTRFAENARKIVSLDGTQIGNTNIVLRPMMYVIE